MALTWQLSDIADYRETCFRPDGALSGGTECVIYASLFIGIPILTEQNYADFFKRFHSYETIWGPLSTSDERLPLSLIKAHIGLRTNASPLTEAAFRKKCLARLALDADAAFSSAIANRP